jgi:DNA relaxase NicK
VKFDAYAGNIRGGRTEQVAELVSFGLKGRVERARPRGRYNDAFEVKDGADVAGWLAHDPQLDAVYFEFKGQRTPDAVASIRRHWATSHTVSRADAAEDYDDPDAFDKLVAIMDRAKDPRVQSDMIAPRDGDRGRTFYWGARTSANMVRVYEAGKMKDRLHYMRPHWARAEIQARPAKAAHKLAVASMTPIEVWGLGAWTQRAAEALCEVEVPRFVVPQVAPTFDGTTLYLARAFRRHLAQMLEDHGDWECVGRELQSVWALDDEAKGMGPA